MLSSFTLKPAAVNLEFYTAFNSLKINLAAAEGSKHWLFEADCCKLAG